MSKSLFISLFVILIISCFLPVSADNDISLSVNDKVNVYIESDDLRQGYDWDEEKEYNEIKKASITQTKNKTLVTLPNTTQYVIWLNKPESEDWHYFDIDFKIPYLQVNLSHMLESYDFPNIVLSGDFYRDDAYTSGDTLFRSFEFLSFPDAIPSAEIKTDNENGTCQFNISTSLKASKIDDDLLVSVLDFSIMHAPENGEIAFWLSSVYEEDYEALSKASIPMEIKKSCKNNKGDKISWETPKNSPAIVKQDGIFVISYEQLLKGSSDFLSADLDGDDDYEIENPKLMFEKK